MNKASKILFILFCLLRIGHVQAQWYTNPDQPRHCLDVGFGIDGMCSDGTNGAYFAGLWGSYTGFWGHVNAAGYLSNTNEEPPFTHLMLVDTSGFVHSNITLVPSQPDGSVIIITQRYRFEPDSFPDPWYLQGYGIAKFDTTGYIGFGQVDITDSRNIIRKITGSDFGEGGLLDVHSDQHGGIHIMVDTAEWAPPSYYNHLQADGQWTYPWPGLLLVGEGEGSILKNQEDGYGGVLVFAHRSEISPVLPGQVTVRRFNSNGQPMFDECPSPRPDLFIAESALLEQGSILVVKDSLITETPLVFRYLAFRLDTNGVNQWEPLGRPILREEGVSYIAELYPDKQGGFFLSAFYRADSVWISHRYNGNAEHLCQAQPSNRIGPRYADETGGAYYVFGTNTPLIQPPYVSVWRWGSDFQLAWPESTLAVRQPSGSLGRLCTMITEDHAVIGAVGYDETLFIFRVNPDGTLGPNADVHLPEVPVVHSFQLHDAYPNPFNPSTTINFSLSHPSKVKLAVYDMLGRNVKSALPCGATGMLTEGKHSVAFDGTGLPSGIYFMRMEAGGFVQTKKMMLLR